MSERALASATHRRGILKDPSQFEKLFEHLDIKDGKWTIKQFKGIIRGDKHNSQLPHNVEVSIKNKAQLADYFDIGERTLDAIIKEFPNGLGNAKRKKSFADPHAAEYDITNCHSLILDHYTKGGTVSNSKMGEGVDSMGRLLYLMFGRQDPALFTLDQFKTAKADPRFKDVTGEITYANLSQIRCVMQFAAMELEESPLHSSNFRFKDGDEWTTKGKKNIGGKKDGYLQEEEHLGFIKSINEIDTLVMARLVFEGMSRISSGLLMGKNNVDGKGYNSLMLGAPIYACTMFEPKVRKSKTGGKVKRYFTPETIKFFEQYRADFNITGAWFNRSYDSFSACFKAAGYRAGLWRFKTARKGDALDNGEKLDLGSQLREGRFLVYTLKPFNNRSKATIEYFKAPVVEGKMTASHIVGKHTGVSIAGLHGWSLDNCAEQAGTDPSTIRDFYHGTLGVDLQKVVMGVRTFVPWHEYIKDTINPLFQRRYNELRRQGVNMEAIAATERQFAIVGGEE